MPRAGRVAAAGNPSGPGELVVYGRVLVDALSGRSRLSVSGAEAEATRRIIEPVLDAWTFGASPFSEYLAGWSGPAPARA